MKTAIKPVLSALISTTALGLALVLSCPAAQAADAPATLAPSGAAPAGAPSIALPAPDASMPVPGGLGNTPASRAKNLSALEDKVSDSVKNVVKQLSSIDSVNLDDLNTARQAVAKLDILIDIEKHLAELDKIHNERSGGSEKALAAAIPASALAAPPSLTSTALPKTTTHFDSQPISAPAPRAEISKIIGADGHYIAVVQSKNYKVGDSLPNGDTITSITARQVTTKAKDGVMHQLKVRGVDEVFGRTL